MPPSTPAASVPSPATRPSPPLLSGKLEPVAGGALGGSPTPRPIPDLAGAAGASGGDWPPSCVLFAPLWARAPSFEAFARALASSPSFCAHACRRKDEFAHRQDAHRHTSTRGERQVRRGRALGKRAVPPASSGHTQASTSLSREMRSRPPAASSPLFSPLSSSGLKNCGQNTCAQQVRSGKQGRGRLGSCLWCLVPRASCLVTHRTLSSSYLH